MRACPTNPPPGWWEPVGHAKMMGKPVPAHPELAVAFNFLPYDQKQLLLMPPSLQEWVAEGSLPRFISDAVDEFDREGELGAFYARYRSDGWGRAAYPPAMMVKVLLYGYCLGVRSSRKLAQALEMDVAFRYLAANLRPDFRTISDFRKDHLEAVDGLFKSVLGLCGKAGLVKLGQVALDGRRLAGNAALERNRSKEQLQAIVRSILQEAEETDAAEDQLYGPDKRGDELPEELRNREARLKVIREGIEEMKQAEEEVRAEYEEKVRAREQQEQETGRKARGRKPRLDQKKIDRLKMNLTDPDSRILKSRKGYVQGYNGQAMVSCETQVIVAQHLRQEQVDFRLVEPMLERCEQQAGERPGTCIMDAGYWSEANAALSDDRTRLLIAVGSGAAVEGRSIPHERKSAPKSGPRAMAMRAELETEEGRATYRKRAQSVEPVFGQMHERGINDFLLRGVRKVAMEWSLICTTHNLLKLWRAGGLAIA